MPIREIAFLLFPDFQLLDLTGPLQVFATANDLAGATHYRLSVVTPGGGAVTSTSGLAVEAQSLDAVPADLDTLLLPGGRGVHAAATDAGLTDWVRSRADRARRTAAVCTGAFLLARTGLLDGRRAVTHWQFYERLAAAYPAVDAQSDPIFVKDGPIWTSAGITAGIDLALALVEEDCGAALALEVARHLVVFLKRPGGQSQYSAALSLQSADDRFERLHGWMAEHLGEALPVARLAEQAGMSGRSFARHYREKVGRTPAEAVERLRVEAARRLLTESTTPAKRIAQRCGFGSEETMRRAFLRQISVNPQDYRSRFRASA